MDIEGTLKERNFKDYAEEFTKLKSDEVCILKKQVAKVAMPNAEKARKEKQITQGPSSLLGARAVVMCIVSCRFYHVLLLCGVWNYL